MCVCVCAVKPVLSRLDFQTHPSACTAQNLCTCQPTYLQTYLPTYLPACLSTHAPPYLHAFVPTYIRMSPLQHLRPDHKARFCHL